jgi:hypothetical protein
MPSSMDNVHFISHGYNFHIRQIHDTTEAWNLALTVKKLS